MGGYTVLVASWHQLFHKFSIWYYAVVSSLGLLHTIFTPISDIVPRMCMLYLNVYYMFPCYLHSTKPALTYLYSCISSVLRCIVIEVNSFLRTQQNMCFYFLHLRKETNPIYKTLCSLVFIIHGYRFGGPGSIPGTTRKKSSVSGTGSTQPREYNWRATW
jgi:hypothetical protein